MNSDNFLGILRIRHPQVEIRTELHKAYWSGAQGLRLSDSAPQSPRSSRQVDVAGTCLTP